MAELSHGWSRGHHSPSHLSRKHKLRGRLGGKGIYLLMSSSHPVKLFHSTVSYIPKSPALLLNLSHYLPDLCGGLQPP